MHDSSFLIPRMIIASGYLFCLYALEGRNHNRHFSREEWLHFKTRPGTHFHIEDWLDFYMKTFLRIAHWITTLFFNILFKMQKNGAIPLKNDDFLLKKRPFIWFPILKKRPFIVKLAAPQTAPNIPVSRNCKIIGHFSIQNHRFSGEILHYLCIFNRKSQHCIYTIQHNNSIEIRTVV